MLIIAILIYLRILLISTINYVNSNRIRRYRVRMLGFDWIWLQLLIPFAHWMLLDSHQISTISIIIKFWVRWFLRNITLCYRYMRPMCIMKLLIVGSWNLNRRLPRGILNPLMRIILHKLKADGRSMMTRDVSWLCWLMMS